MKETQLKQHRLLKQQEFNANFLEQQRKIDQPRIYFSLLQKGMGSLKISSIHNFHYREMQKFFGQMPMAKVEIEGWLNRDYQLVVMTENEERAIQVQETFKDFKLKAKILNTKEKIQKNQLQILPYTLQQGFELIEEKIAVLTEAELFNRIAKKKDDN